MIFLGADHAGFKLKETIKKHLQERGESVTDLGTNSDASVDYPEYAKKVADSVIKQSGKGILICKSGEGMSIAANKITGIRASLVWNPTVAKETKADNDANVICLPAGFIDEKTAQEIVSVWLSTPFSSEERHLRRINQIKQLEKL